MQPVSFLKIRLAQTLRELKALGLFYSIILLAGIIGFMVFFYKTQDSEKNVIIASVLIVFIIFSLHFSRSDHNFISHAADNPSFIYSSEYVTFILPFIILSWIKSGVPMMLFSTVPVILISFIVVKKKSMDATAILGKLVPEYNYEWKAGLRHSGWIFVVLWIAALMLVFVPFASLIILWFMLLIVSSFYDQGESAEMVESFKLDHFAFIRKKIIIQTAAFLGPTIPVLLLSSFFFPDRWWVFFLFFVFSILNISVFVVSKYSVWRHGELNKSNSIVNGLCIVGFFMPFLLPLPVFVLIKNFRKSIHNLKPLLHDYHR